MNPTPSNDNKTEFIRLEAESPSIISSSCCNKKTSSSSVGDLHQAFDQKGVFLHHQQQRVEMSTDNHNHNSNSNNNNNSNTPQLHQGTATKSTSTTTATDKVLSLIPAFSFLFLSFQYHHIPKSLEKKEWGKKRWHLFMCIYI